MSLLQVIVLAITILMASHAARESMHSLKRLIYRISKAAMERRLVECCEVIAVAMMTLGHGIYYWVIALLTVYGTPIGH